MNRFCVVSEIESEAKTFNFRRNESENWKDAVHRLKVEMKAKVESDSK